MNLKKLLLSTLLVSPASAVELPSIFSDNMVLQRKQPVKVWGTSDSDKVKVTFAGQSSFTDVKDGKWEVGSGKWEVKLKPMRARC